MRTRSLLPKASFACAVLLAACGGVDPAVPDSDGVRSDGMSSYHPACDGDHDGDDTPPGELPAADVAVSKVGLPPVVAAQTDLTYEITVSNIGGQPAEAVQLVDNLPLSTQFITVATSRGSCLVTLGSVTCLLGTLEPGAVVDIRLVVRPVVPGVTITNVANVTTTSIETNLTNNVASAQNLVVVVNRGRGRGRHLGWDRH